MSCFSTAFSDRTGLVEPWTIGSRARSARAGSNRAARRHGDVRRGCRGRPDRAGAARRRKKAIVIISDGNDRNSTTDVRSIRRLIRETEVLVYAVGIDGESQSTWSTGSPRPPRLPWPFPPTGRNPPQWPRQPQPRYPRMPGGTRDDGVNVSSLRELTDDSGGRTEIVRHARDLGPATAGIADELSRQYFARLCARWRPRTAAGTQSASTFATATTWFAHARDTWRCRSRLRCSLQRKAQFTRPQAHGRTRPLCL